MRLTLTALLATLVAAPAAAQQAAPGTPTECPAPAGISTAALRRVDAMKPRLAALADEFGESASTDAIRADSVAGGAAGAPLVRHAMCQLAMERGISSSEWRYFVLKVAPSMKGGRPRPRPVRAPAVRPSLDNVEPQVAAMRAALTRMSRVEAETDRSRREAKAKALHDARIVLPSTPGLSEARLREACVAGGVRVATSLAALNSLLKVGMRDLLAANERVNRLDQPNLRRAALLHEVALTIPLAFDLAVEAAAPPVRGGGTVECGQTWSLVEGEAVRAMLKRVDELVKAENR